MGKRLKNDKKCAIFQNWLKTHPKVLNAQNERILHHFGGMLALKSGLGFFVSAPEVPFFGTSKRALSLKLPVFLCQKMALRAPKQKKRDHFSTPTSPQNGAELICFVRLALLGWF